MGLKCFTMQFLVFGGIWVFRWAEQKLRWKIKPELFNYNKELLWDGWKRQKRKKL